MSSEEAAARLVEVEALVPLAVRRRLAKLSTGSRLQFYLTPKGSLSGETPMEALANGKIHRVLVAAEGFAER